MSDKNKSNALSSSELSRDPAGLLNEMQDMSKLEVSSNLPQEKIDMLRNPILECLGEILNESKKTSEKLDKILDELHKLRNG
jgi:hypothetical protein